MLRFRRYRVLLIFAVFITAILIRFTHIRDWETLVGEDVLDVSDSRDSKIGQVVPPLPPKGTLPTTSETTNEQLKEESKPVKEIPSAILNAPEHLSTPTPMVALTSMFPAQATADLTIPKVKLPDRKRPSFGDVYENVDDGLIHPIAPDGRQELPMFPTAPTTIHWSKQPEHFPVPTESIIPLPTGRPLSIPKIQYAFKDETTDAKINREKRQNKVKEEFLRSWKGYKKYAWGHDELSPVSGKFRDPFCGWAATLVDALDTLWIMGLYDEFDDAVRAVELIDFTYTPRMEIPMFETTIRYLGGLLAAYDVSGGKYPSLLNKAVELADILMGAFDTPNRMPILHYKWKPAFASQPHRAGVRSNLAELGSLSMEFTRLAQLTNEPRYYDAVARVTNALSEWQDRNTTKLPGVFPDNVDASGCNRTATNLRDKAAKEAEMESGSPLNTPQAAEIVKGVPEGYKPPTPKTVLEPKPKKKNIGGDQVLEMNILPGEPSKAHIQDWDEMHKAHIQNWDEVHKEKRGLEEQTGSSAATEVLPSVPQEAPEARQRHPVPAGNQSSGIVKGVSFSDQWDCVEQGLDSANPAAGSDRFSMGGGQDSTYEYFPKQYLLLGGLEKVYEKMYSKTAKTIRDYMLYRPMTPNNDDILFSGKVSTKGVIGDEILHAEVTHLTCFIGGMVGMGAKIFGIDGDLELAKKLTDGCVWAYASTASGIMPEGATTMACQSAEHCTWNQTLYYNYLDPSADFRDSNVAQYVMNQEKLAADRKAKYAAFEEGHDQSALEKASAVGKPQGYSDSVEPDSNTSKEDVVKQTAASNTESSASAVEDKDAFKPKDKPLSLTKRQSNPKLEIPTESKGTMGKSGPGTPDGMVDEKDNMFKQKSVSTEAELINMATGRQLNKEGPSQKPLPADDTLPDPLRPLSHKEFVESRIKQESLPAGFVGITSRKYILRPEAIESVWYMYRITGDSTWQDKGWKMFESVIKYTATPYGNSAIYDVTAEETYQIDEMESFWLAETLKYFYLLYSTPDEISLDDWVLNTEAHPFKRPDSSSKK